MLDIIQNIVKRLKPLGSSSSVPENWHEDFIVHIAKILRPHLYVELGLYQCVLFNRIIPYAKTLIGVDVDPNAGKFMLKVDKSQFINTSTEEFAKELQRKPLFIDMLFIDADHSAKAVKNDFDNYFPFVSPHGIIILHDGHPQNRDYIDSRYCGDGYKTIAKLSRYTKEYEMVTIPVHPGLTICRKRKTQLKWQEVKKISNME